MTRQQLIGWGGAQLEADSSYLVRYKYLSHHCTQTPVPISMLTEKVKTWEASSRWFLLLISSVWPPQHSETGVTSVENKKLEQAVWSLHFLSNGNQRNWTNMFCCRNGQNNVSQHTKLPDGVQAVFSVSVWSYNFFFFKDTHKTAEYYFTQNSRWPLIP